MPSPARLVVADVDGTLVGPDKLLTERTRAVVRRVVEAGVAFTITSGRPPLGMKALIAELGLREPIIAFNGGLIVRPDLSAVRERLVSSAAARSVVEIMTRHGLDVWIYGDDRWYVPSRHGPHVDREERTVGFAPAVVSTYAGLLERVVKIVGVGRGDRISAQCAAEVRQQLGGDVSAALSQPYYLDVTHPEANKGEAVGFLSTVLGIPPAEIVTVGDMPNDVLMFRRSGLSIAMGNASGEVKAAATFVTAPDEEDGFALAMERFVLRTRTDGTMREAHGRRSGRPRVAR
jgi:Cof subfamily protein (haloacid dehalogenase superfamily)